MALTSQGFSILRKALRRAGYRSDLPVRQVDSGQNRRTGMYTLLHEYPAPGNWSWKVNVAFMLVLAKMGVLNQS